MLRDLSADHSWDVLFLQEFSTARPEGLQMADGHAIIIAGSERRKSSALIIHKRWIPYISKISGKNGIATAELHVPQNPPLNY